MSRSALIVQLMISSPSDLPTAHRQIIQRAIRVWNLSHGTIYGIHFSPTDWEEGGSPAFGEYPQAVLNEQIVDDSDIALVVFTDRMGTPTPDHPSGTAEEIAKFLESGKDVAILQNSVPRAPLRADALAQKQELAQYIDSLKPKAFLAEYESEQRLREITDSLLSAIAGKYRKEVNKALVNVSSEPESSLATTDVEDDSLGVWPRVEVSEYAETDAKGRLHSRRRWRLVLQSNVPRPVKNVRFRYVDSNGERSMFDAFSNEDDWLTEIIPPLGSVAFSINRSLGSPAAAVCVVDWEDAEGKHHSTQATVRVG